ncbi:peroxisome assembly protein 10-B-like [Zophobas morio]|uniref:peroxisome assembly protein 10-B-like n=1 Tax=Zophobas morio TaxID=2755281 RepID=UPI0030839B25
MNFSEAGVADVLRCAQRDESFVRDMQDNVQAIVKLFSSRKSHATQRIIPALTNAWYYCMTTLGNIQTLGEEYTGTLRFDKNKKIPSKTIELVWLLLYLGGEPLYDRLIHSLQNNIKNSHELTEEAQSVFLKILGFFHQHKQALKRIHHSLFYMDGKYYNISNRIMGVKYVLVREWLRDDTFTYSFKLLGQLSLFYILFNFIQQVWSFQSAGNIENVTHGSEVSRKDCILCAESRKNPCVTPCGHIFCWDCICDSLCYQHSCPICREVVLPNRIILLQNYV